MSGTVIVLGRAPVAGQVKTRLATTIGDERAARLYRAFLEDSCALAAVSAARRVLAVTGDATHPELLRLAARHEMELVPQVTGDLGQRMERAIAAALAAGQGPVCLIGSDAPTLPAGHLEEAFASLAERDLVLGPATDGGYYLVGLRRAAPELFAGMAWGGATVLLETLRRAPTERTTLLPFWYDVDDGDDLAWLRAHLALLEPEVAPATRRALAADGGIC